MDVFDLRNRLIDDYARYVRSFVEIKDERIRDHVDAELAAGAFWPQPRVALNPAFEPGASVSTLVESGVLHRECARVFQRKEPVVDDATGEDRVASAPLNLHRHQEDAIRAARTGRSYVLTTGTGSGKSLTYIVPIVDHVLRTGTGGGIKAIVVYPMNALANSQLGELDKFLKLGYPDGPPVTFERYTGQEGREDRDRILAAPPDILLTNYVMLELILTRVEERPLVKAAEGLPFLVLDELHTYRGRQGADVALLVRRVREACRAPALQCVGTSATLAAGGTVEDQRRQVAEVASGLFGSPVDPADVIGESLRRQTVAADLDAVEFSARLRERVAAGAPPDSPPFERFVADPLSIWIEHRLGVTETEGRLVRTVPRPITGAGGAAEDLAAATGLPVDRCADAIKAQLLAGCAVRHPETGLPVFAFRLHQFIRRGDTAYVSIGDAGHRHVTLEAQRFVPGDRAHHLFPVVFCRECGQEYLRVRSEGEVGARTFVPPFGDEGDPDHDATGYLYISDGGAWPDSEEEATSRLPDDWVEEIRGVPRVRHAYRKHLPQPVLLDGRGREGIGAESRRAWYVPGSFRFCLACGVAYYSRQRDFARVATLAAGGRSSATTVLTLEAVRALRADRDLPNRARKLLAFTDNRQDASLQAGHFNDFVQVGLLRAALYQAARNAGTEGLTHEVLTLRVFEALHLPPEAYAVHPDAKYGPRIQIDQAMRQMIGHRTYVDLQRGWRLTAPNLEQCGLIRIDYLGLDELCADAAVWAGAHEALAAATPDQRRQVCRTLLDHMRRELAIKVDYLDVRHMESVKQAAGQRLRPAWRFESNERPQAAGFLVPRPRRPGDDKSLCHLSARSGFGHYLRRAGTLPHEGGRGKLKDSERIIADLVERLAQASFIEEVPGPAEDAACYQLVAASMQWRAGDGATAFHDPVRVPNQPPQGLRPNPYFVEYYRRGTTGERDLEAREHTAQVPALDRERREREFGDAILPILFCSPTMELGVDIKELNVVGMRNVPPTPANYAQRSGRAGRSGQAALVFTYCTTGSAHDQYFFSRPEEMVSGQVAPPRLDLANEDLLRAHVHAIWLAESGVRLGSSLKDVLDVGGETPSLDVRPTVREALRDPGVRARTLARAERALADVLPPADPAYWWREGWLRDVVHGMELQFDNACGRWRSLYRAARAQMETQFRILTDASRPQRDKQRARRLLAQAETQARLLLAESEPGILSDFNSYRYLASEGFLPGYSFPRLPLSAFIPGRTGGAGEDEYVQRARFLAISEFGPRNLVYHEGGRYEIDRVLLPISESDPSGSRAGMLTSAKRCGRCGYHHPAVEGMDVCEHCRAELDVPLNTLFRLQNVSTRRRDRISCDEEERRRQGYVVRTSVRFEEAGDRPAAISAEIADDAGAIAHLTYGQAATIWRINMGWRRHAPGDEGFWIDLETGYWRKGPEADEEPDEEDEVLGPRQQRVIPYVEDRRNCLLLSLPGERRPDATASLQWALAAGIQAVFQLEDGELAAEALPDESRREWMLFYEAAEGGAGALRRLLHEDGALREVARKALEICHFDPDTGRDAESGPGAPPPCEAACYRCLLNYRNQPDHRQLDRKRLPPLLLRLASARVRPSPAADARETHLKRLLDRAESSLEKQWLEWLEATGRRLPDDAQAVIVAAGTRPDFLYRAQGYAIYVDGPIHEFPDRAERDAAQAAALEDIGWTVLRFRARDDWDALADGWRSVFGGRR